jgi:hypothetical protein
LLIIRGHVASGARETGGKMKKLLFLLLINLNLIQVTAVLVFLYGNKWLFIIPGFFAFTAVVIALVNIIGAVSSVKGAIIEKEKQVKMSQSVLLYKLLAMPYYLLNYLLWFWLASILMIMPGNVLFILIVLPVVTGFAYLMLIAASSYSIALLLALKKNNEIPLKKFVLHTICQLIFVLDVVGQIFILRLVKRKNKVKSLE